MGTTNLCTSNKREKIFHIKNVVIHPNYFTAWDTEYSGDIAILTTYSNLIGYQPICLPSQGTNASE